MTLRRIRITDVRCLAEVELALDPLRNYIYGANGAGKTSILEAIFLLGRGRSFRTRQLRRLVRYGRKSLAVYGEIQHGDSVRRVGVALRDGRIEKRVDGQPAASAGALVELLPLHTIDPSTHELIQGGPSERRRYLDWGVFHVEQRYLEAWRRYRRTLSQRNAVLKKGARPSELATWTAAVADAGESVDRGRAEYLALLRPELEAQGRALLGQALEAHYDRGWPMGVPLAEALIAAEPRDRAGGNTELGPHRADLSIALNGVEVQGSASRGQQKLAAAALVCAQVAVFGRARGRSTLLIDDAAAELDSAALGRLMAALDGLDAQLVLTALSASQLPAREPSATFHVERGGVL